MDPATIPCLERSQRLGRLVSSARVPSSPQGDAASAQSGGFWQSATLSEVDYVRGVIPLAGWPQGVSSLRLPTSDIVQVTVDDEVGFGASLFVWNYLRPGQSIESVAPNGGRPGLVRVAAPPAAVVRRRISRGEDDQLDAGDYLNETWRVAAEAVNWLGPGASFEAVWAFVAHRGIRVGPVALAQVIQQRFIIDEVGCVFEDAEAKWRGRPSRFDDGWDTIEVAYWELVGDVDPPHLERVYRNKKPSLFDGLEYHLDELQHPLLSADEERRLGTLIRKGQRAERDLDDAQPGPRRDQLGIIVAEADAARTELTSRNLRLVFNIAKKNRPRIAGTALDLADIVQAGYVGLLRAVEKFEPERGFRFSTYATWWIRQAISRSIANRRSTIRLPVHVHDQVVSMERARSALRSSLGREPSSDDLAADLGISADRVRELELYSTPLTSLEQLVADQSPQLDALVDPRSDPFETFSDHRLRVHLTRAMEALADRERTVLQLRFGWFDDRVYTLEEIGGQFNVTRERIRQLEKKALTKLRRSSGLEHLTEWVPLSPTTGAAADDSDTSPTEQEPLGDD